MNFEFREAECNLIFLKLLPSQPSSLPALLLLLLLELPGPVVDPGSPGYQQVDHRLLLQVPLHGQDQSHVGLPLLDPRPPRLAPPPHHHRQLTLWLGSTTRYITLTPVMKPEDLKIYSL